MLKKADAPSTRGGGKWSNFSISGNRISTCEMPLACLFLIISGKRCRVCGPNTTSTYGARLMMLSPSCVATQPPTPITKFGFFSFSGINRPRWLKTLSSAFSRTEQVLSKITSASSGVNVSIMPSVAFSRSAMRDESYSFIWQPKVLINTFLGRIDITTAQIPK